MKYNINNNNFPNLIRKIIEFLDDSKYEINELLKIDYKYSKMKVDLESLKKLLEALKNEKIGETKEQKIKIIYNGNPYITLNISLLAILTNTRVYFECNQNMLGINTYIVSIINDFLNDFNTENLLCLEKKVNEERHELDKIICIDDVNKYNNYLLRNIKKVRFYAFDYVDLFYDTDEFEELLQLMYDYGEENQLPIESYSEFDIEDAIELMDRGYGNIVVVFTNSENTKRIFRKVIKKKKLFINKNPYKERKIILRDIFYI